VGAFGSLWRRKYRLARLCAAGQVTLILWGWAVAQFPYIVEPDITIQSAAAPRETLRLLIGALGAGAVVLFPSFYYLFRVFKGHTAFAALTNEADSPGIEDGADKHFSPPG
jgi:cytochrome d ubiquinol oxidase subunit II